MSVLENTLAIAEACKEWERLYQRASAQRALLFETVQKLTECDSRIERNRIAEAAISKMLK